MTIPKVSILLFLVLGLSCAADYQEIPASQYSQAPIPSLQAIGLNYVLNKAKDAGKIENTDFYIRAVNHIYKKVSGSYNFYKFDISLRNNNADKFDTVFEIRYDTKTKKNLITFYSYAIVYYHPSNGQDDGYEPVPADQYGSSSIQNLANFGKNYIVNQAVSRGKLPAGVYDLVMIRSVEKEQVSQNVANYRFEIEFEKDDGTRDVDAGFEVSYNASTGKMNVFSYNYQVVIHNA